MPLSRTFHNLIRPEAYRNAPEYRRRVEWLMLLRLIVTTLVLVTTIFFHLRESGELFVHTVIPLYVLIGTIFVLSIIYALALPLVPDLWIFSFIQVLIDVLYATVLIHFTGGASSVFTILYIFPIVTAGILHLRRGAMIVASLACLCFGILINLEFYGVIPPADWPWVSPWSKNTPGYLLWVLIVHFTFFFLLAILASSLSEQLQRAKISLNVTKGHFKNLADLHRSIVTSIPSGIMTADTSGRIGFINESGRALLQVSSDKIIGAHLDEVFPVTQISGDTTGRIRETFRTTKDICGEIRSFELSVADLRGLDAISTGRLVIFQDITEIQKMEDRVKLSEKQAAFVRIAAGMAHEIRNPLAALRGATELLTQTGHRDSGVDKRLLGIVIRESDRLNNLLGDFLLTVGVRQGLKSILMLNDLVEDTLILFSQEPTAGRIKIETRLSKGIQVEGDAPKLKQALWNLLNNALEADSGVGVIRVTLESDSKSESAILKVQDFGLGVDAAIKEWIFEPFTTTKEKGTGLGLALALSIVEAHNGALEMDSTPGAGTTFSIRLPLSPTETARR